MKLLEKIWKVTCNKHYLEMVIRIQEPGYLETLQIPDFID